MKGIFITFEGCEGSGKTTLINRVYDNLVAMGKKVYKTREPGGVEIAEQIRNVILNVDNVKMDKRTEALLYAASRRQHLIEVVIPKLEDGYIVLCDRYIDSSLAYQGYAREIGIEEVLNVNLFATAGLLPDKTIYVDVDPKIGLARIRDNNRNQNRLDLEHMNFHEMVYEGYKKVEELFPDRFININGNQDKDAVYNDCMRVILDLIK